MRFQSVLLLCMTPFALAAFAGCGDDEAALGECPTSSEAQQALGDEALQASCASCHSTSSQNRAGAPAGINVDDDAYVKSNAGELYEEVESGSMPPTGKLPAADIENIRVYLACTAN
jgi:uncharacterized membrane protein